MNMEIQLQLIISFRNHMMTAARRHESEETVLSGGKGTNSVSTSPGVFIVNSGDVYICTENSNTHISHVTFACIHYSLPCFHLTLTIPLLAIKVLYVQQHGLRKCGDIVFVMGSDREDCRCASLCLPEETKTTNKQIDAKLRKMCYLYIVNNQVIASTITKKSSDE